MTDLGTLKGYKYSKANFVSADGAVVVGQLTNPKNDGRTEAFRWDSSTKKMKSLGSLGGVYTTANALSADGTVIVGDSQTKNYQTLAFRWDSSTKKMQSLETLPGGYYSSATAVSANGAVIVGNSSYDKSDFRHAFRWEGGVMTDLDALAGHKNSYANAVSADGRVVVGTSGNVVRKIGNDGPISMSARTLEQVPIQNELNQVFRWSTTDGMQSVADWVTAAGGAIPEGYALTDATGVNDDGSIVTGQGRYNDTQVAWLAKGNGFLSDTDAFDRSVIQAGGSAVSVGIATTNLALNGSHHRTLLDSGLAMSENETCAWSTVDAARNDTTKATTTLGEIGICGDVAGYRIGAGVGTTKTKQDWDLGGSARYSGDYLLAEVGREFATAGSSTLQASLLMYHAAFDTTLNRAYASGAGVDISTGRPDMKASALKARLDWKNATTMGAFSVSPYSTLTVTRAKVAGYTEAGGAFPAVYAPTTTNTTDLRIGAAFSGKIAPKTTLYAQVEAVHQFQDATAGINGQVTGLYAFNLPGQKMTRNWGRITMDVDYALTPTTILTAGFGASTKSSQSSAGITLGIRAAF